MSAQSFYAASPARLDLPDRGGEIPVNCFLEGHDDRHASATINGDSGLWNCHTCGVGGTAFHAAVAMGMARADAAQLAKDHDVFHTDRSGDDHATPRERRAPRPAPTKPSRRPPAPLPTDQQIDGWNRALLDDAKKMAWLFDVRAWSREVIEGRRIGYDAARRCVTIPVTDGRGELVQFLEYRPGESGAQKIRATAGRERVLFPPPEEWRP